VKRARKRVFISSRVLTSEDAIAELEERGRTKPQRRAARGRRVIGETIPGQVEGVEAGNFEAEDGPAYEGWRARANMAMPPDPANHEEEG
jgi:hypothetical protein